MNLLSKKDLLKRWLWFGNTEKLSIGGSYTNYFTMFGYTKRTDDPNMNRIPYLEKIRCCDLFYNKIIDNNNGNCIFFIKDYFKRDLTEKIPLWNEMFRRTCKIWKLDPPIFTQIRYNVVGIQVPSCWYQHNNFLRYLILKYLRMIYFANKVETLTETIDRFSKEPNIKEGNRDAQFVRGNLEKIKTVLRKVRYIKKSDVNGLIDIYPLDKLVNATKTKNYA